MRTTIDVDERLLIAAKQRAAAEGLTLRRLIEEALRLRLVADAPASEVMALPVFSPRRPGTRPGVVLTDNAVLRDLMDEDR